MKATAEIYLDPRPRKDGTCTVKIKVTHNRKRKYYSTDISMSSNEFEKLLFSKRRSREQNSILTKLEAFKYKADSIINNLKIFTFSKFEEQYFENRNINTSVYYAYDKRIKELKADNKIGTSITYECAKVSLESYKKNLEFADVTPEFLRKYEKFMLSNDRSTTTVSMYLRTLRALFNRNEIDKSLYPFGKNNYEIPVSKNIKKALTIEEIGRIFNYKPTKGSREEQARDYWIFLYLSNGMNVKDFCLLKWENIQDNLLIYERSKTKSSTKDAKYINVALKPETMEIIRRWGVKTLSKDDYIFPHLKKGMTAEQQRRVYQDLTKLINKYIKRIAKSVGIEKEITTYYARHSFATVLKRSGANIAMISELLGHSNLNVTESYLDSFEQDQIHQSTDALVNF